jgi:hypothetical protein
MWRVFNWYDQNGDGGETINRGEKALVHRKWMMRALPAA